VNEKKIDDFEGMESQLETLHEEIGVLSKKSPDGAVNKFKLRFINTALRKANDFLSPHYRPFDDFDTFSEDDLPSNSDVVLMLAHYLRSTDKFRQDNTEQYGSLTYWVMDRTRSERRAKEPRVFRD
jgi:hypothetical protein